MLDVLAPQTMLPGPPAQEDQAQVGPKAVDEVLRGIALAVCRQEGDQLLMAT